MATVMFWLLLVCVALFLLGAWIASGAWAFAVIPLGATAPIVIGLALGGAVLMAWSRRARISVPAARVLVRRRFAKGASV